MASRTSTSVAMGVSLTIFILLSVTLFVLTMVFFSSKQRAEQEIRALESRYEEVVRSTELSSDRVSAVISAATRERESAVSHLLKQNRELKQLAVGNADVDMETASERIAQTTDLAGGSMLERIRQLNQRVRSAEQAAAEARNAAQRAEEDARNAIELIQAGQQRVDEVVAEAGGRLNTYQGNVERYRSNIDTFVAEVERERDAERSAFQDRLAEKDDRIAELQEELLIARERGRGAGADDAALRPTDEYALVDGEIAYIDAVDGTVIISIGRQDKVTIGLTFSVYSDAAALRSVSGTGIYPRGKAVIEVIRVDETSSRCRILSESRGNPVVAGDIIVNPLFDPNKTYKFVVYGEFDTNRDGQTSTPEANRLKALIREWGGETVDEVQGDLDFLVLGARPTLPPPPGGDAPRSVIDEYVRLSSLVDRYDELLARASAASIPVLNENRLYTLIGHVPN